MGTASGRDTLCVFIRLHNKTVNLEDRKLLLLNRVKDVKTAFFQSMNLQLIFVFNMATILVLRGHFFNMLVPP